MIEDIRFVVRNIIFNGDLTTMKVLQVYDGYVWFDVPIEIEEEQQ